MTQPTSDKLTITIAGKGPNVDAFAFAETLRDALDAILHVDEGVSSVDGGSIKWEIVGATLNSPLTVTMRGVPKVAADFSSSVLKTFLDGIETIDREGRAPPTFAPRAVEAVKRFATHLENGIGTVTFATAERRYSPSNRLITNSTAIVNQRVAEFVHAERPDYYEFGEIDGSIENLIGHNQLYFSLYDALSGVRVRCTFRPELSGIVGNNWLKRVVVNGRIKYGPDGKPKEIKVESVTPKPGRDSLPQFKGNYINITGGVESSSFVRGLRDDD